MMLLLEGSGPIGNERVVDYNLFLTEAFGSFGSTIAFSKGQLESELGPDSFDGLPYKNDDSYRRSRHLLINSTAEDRSKKGNLENLRENSLARQLSEKTDQPATIRLIRRRKAAELAKLPEGEPRVPWINLIPPNTKFFLEQVNEAREEKVQVIDTFGEWVAFFFGRKPEIYSYSGTLLNSKNHDWKNEFQDNYDNFLRGSQAVKYRATMIIQYDDVMVEGYMLNCAISQSAQADKSVPFQFTLLVINRSSLNPTAAFGYRVARSGGTLQEKMLFESMSASLKLIETGPIDDVETFLIMREYFSGNYAPPAGKVTNRGDGKIETSESVQPGTVGGTQNHKRPRSPLDTDTSDSVDQNQITLPDGSSIPVF
jgi:hypothetical protein